MKGLFNSKILILFSLFYAMFHFGYSSNESDNGVAMAIDKYKQTAPGELLKMGDSFASRNLNDSAMICYSLIYNDMSNVKSIEFQQVMCNALNRASTIYFYNCDYQSALELLLEALSLCEKIGYDEYISNVYNNMGNVYYQFKDYKQARKYYILAYRNHANNHVLGIVLNNLGLLAHGEKKLDSALLLYKKAYIIRKKDSTYSGSLNNIGLIHESLKNYDSALLYYRAALNHAYMFKAEDKIGRVLSDIGYLYVETNKFDSATYYLERSNIIAHNNALLDVTADNLLAFQKIEERKGNFEKSLEYYKQYSIISDSLFNISKYGKINELQFMYDMAKVDIKIKELNVERETKERTIVMQRRLQIIMGLVLLIVMGFLVLLYMKNKTLNKAYNALFSKNVEIVNSDKLNQQMKQDYEALLRDKDLIISKLKGELPQSAESREDIVEVPVKLKRSSLSDDSQNELMFAILEVMNDKSIFCDADFSIEKLAELVSSNKTYISQIINDYFGKNFRTFINDYRIREARRMFSESDYKKYSIESISAMVGFKSKSQFNIIFKEVTGVTPSFYIRSLWKQ